MNYFDNRLSIAIFNIRFGLALFVIYIHFNILNGFVLLGQPIVFESNWLRFIVITIGEVLARISVPLFFFISGYLFFEGIRKGGGSLFYAKNKKKSSFYSCALSVLVYHNFLIFCWAGKFIIKSAIPKCETVLNY